MSRIVDRLSLSTCWCSRRHTDGYAMIEEMVGLGFKRIELSHGIRMSLVPGILKAVDEKRVEISSVHNFCPLPGAVNYPAPNFYEPSSTDKRERSSWKRYTLQTIDFAKKVGARKVVLHSGHVRFFQSPEKKLKKWIQSQGLGAKQFCENRKFIRKRDRAIQRIQKASRKPMQHVEASYREAIEWAKEYDLKLCVENREGLMEMPLDDDFLEFIHTLSAPEQIGYWHDTGHAQIKHQFGLLDHREHLCSLKEHLAGFHFHDVTDNGIDHQPIGIGEVDFKMIAEFVRPEHELVLELSPQLTPQNVLTSRDYLCELLGS